MLYFIACAVCIGIASGIVYFVCEEGADEIWMNAIAVGAAACLYMTSLIMVVAGIVSLCGG